MRELKIILPKGEYTPGEVITGVLEITCDKKFDSKETSISFIGSLKAEGYTIGPGSRGGVVKTTTKVAGNVVDGSIVLSKKMEYEAGTHSFDFSFQLPVSRYRFLQNLDVSSGLLPSRAGISESVKYVIQAKIDVSRFKSEQAQTPISIYIPLDEFPEVVKNEKSLLDKGKNILDLETDTDIYCIGQSYQLRYRINTTDEIKKLRFEFIHEEHCKLGTGGGSTIIPLYSEEITPHEGLNEWHTVVLQPDVKFPQSFTSEVVFCTLQLRIYVEMKRKKLETGLALLAQYCPS
jgi:hypothetical protein